VNSELRKTYKSEHEIPDVDMFDELIKEAAESGKADR
jgi:hypothetical protein